MRVLVACEFTGSVRDAFTARGHEATSCDLLPTETLGAHYQGDVRDILNDGWDLMVAHPPCTHLAVSGARWFKEKQADGRQQAALDFVRLLLDAPIPRIALENPVSIISSKIRKPDQIIQPWMFGHGEQKSTCLWLKNLPLLEPTDIVEGREQRMWLMPPSEDRGKLRSKTYSGIANAMADQWGDNMSFDKARLVARMGKVLETDDPEDEVAEFVRGTMRKKLEDWTRSKAKSGLTRDEREVLNEAYEGPHENWRWHLFHTDRVLWSFLTFGDSDELEPLTVEEIIRDYHEYAVEEGLVADDPGTRLDLKVGMFGTLKMKRGPDKMVCITEITSRGKVKAEKFNEETEEWTAPGYIDPDMLTETWDE